MNEKKRVVLRNIHDVNMFLLDNNCYLSFTGNINREQFNAWAATHRHSANFSLNLHECWDIYYEYYKSNFVVTHFLGENLDKPRWLKEKDYKSEKLGDIHDVNKYLHSKGLYLKFAHLKNNEQFNKLMSDIKNISQEERFVLYDCWTIYSQHYGKNAISGLFGYTDLNTRIDI